MRIAVSRAVLSALCVSGMATMLQSPAFAARRAASGNHVATDSVVVPSWLYPSSPPSVAPPVWDSVTPLHLPRVRVAFTASKLHDLFYAPDWTPSTHPSMPDVVSHGRKPALFACAYCHMPDGRGRPENVPLAGLPAAYIVQQVADMKSHARASAWQGGPWAPYDNMVKVAAAASGEDVSIAAAYFSRLSPRQRTRIVEARSIPRVRPGTGLWHVEAGRGTEPLGSRIIEVPLDNARHDLRDPTLGYVGYVPLGSIARGRAVATRPMNDAKQVCGSCHGPTLRGAGVIPPLAGVSPAYLVRQLLAFKSGARATAASAPMQIVASALSLNDMIAVAAYAATLTR
jgi:cytochrome c553